MPVPLASPRPYAAPGRPTVPGPTRQAMRQALAALAAFGCLFRRSRKGNLWCVYDGRSLTVFGLDDGAGGRRYSWCLAGSGGGTRYSDGLFGTEAEALRDLALEVGAVHV